MRSVLLLTAPSPPPVVNDADVTAWIAGAILLGIVAYAVSLRLHPFARCNWCRGTGRSRGAVFLYAYRDCTHCAGTGKKWRLGRRVFFSGSGSGSTTG